MKSTRSTILIFLGWIFFLPILRAQSESSFFDLSKESFSESVQLNGLWEFYWQELIVDDLEIESELVQVPSDWYDYSQLPEVSNVGYATFKTKIKLPANSKANYGLYIKHVFSAYKVFINGVGVYESGEVGKSKDTYTPFRNPKVLQLPNTSEVINLVIQATNFDHQNSGLYYPISVGYFENLQSELQLRVGINFLLAGGFFITGFVLLAFALSYKHLEIQIPFYALFSISIMYRMIGSDPYPIQSLIYNYPFDWLIHLEYLSIHSAALFGGLFIFSMYPRQTNAKIKSLFIIGTLTSACCVLFFEPLVFTTLLRYFLFFIMAFVMYFIQIIVRARLEKEVTSGFLLVALIFVLLWTAFQIIIFLNIGTVPYYINVILVTLIIVFCNLALFRTLMLKVKYADLAKSEEKLNSVKQSMLSLVSHEIKTPVATLQMHIEMLNASREKALSEKALEKIIKGCTSAIQSIKHMVNDFVYFMSRGGQDIKLLSSEEIIKNLKTRFKGHFIENDSVLISSNVKYKTDLMTLEYVISTLLSNAVKYSKFSQRKPEITLKTKKDQLIVTVTDFGVGMDDEKISELGDMNLKLNQKSEVSGVGFYLALELTKQLGHELKISSELGVGTSISVLINAHD